MKLIAEFCKIRNGIMLHCEVKRDTKGKWYVYIEGRLTQVDLTATEIVRYLSNAAHQEKA